MDFKKYIHDASLGKRIVFDQNLPWVLISVRQIQGRTIWIYSVFVVFVWCLFVLFCFYINYQCPIACTQNLSSHTLGILSQMYLYAFHSSFSHYFLTPSSFYWLHLLTLFFLIFSPIFFYSSSSFLTSVYFKWVCRIHKTTVHCVYWVYLSIECISGSLSIPKSHLQVTEYTIFLKTAGVIWSIVWWICYNELCNAKSLQHY